MRRVVISIASMLITLNLIAPPAHAQSDTCHAITQRALTDFMAHCFGSPAETVCGASGPVQIEMVSGQVIDGPGSTARLSGVAALRALADDDSAWSLASLTVPDRLVAQKSVTLLVLGPAELVFDSDSRLPYGMAFTLTTPADPYPCSDLPHPGVLVQSPENSLTLMAINGTEVAVNGMALIWARDDSSIVVNALTRESILSQSGAVVFAGYMVRALETAVSEVVPYNAAAVQNIPTSILPVMDVISLPGNATMLHTDTLYLRPNPASYTNKRINAGLPATVLGRNSAGDWFYIRSYDGVLGWMPAYSLQVNVPVDIPVFDATPPGPVRPFGSIQGYIKTSEERNNLRAGPGETFDILTTVPLWTELALYGRSPDDQWLLVETLDGVRGWINVWLISTTTPYTMSELPYPPDLES